MLKSSSLEILQSSKNLLAFSAGGDSTSLFFLLLQNNIKFDIAIVDYQMREQSKEEVLYAKKLASTHKLKCHILIAEKIEKNFEAKARAIRYEFFEKTIKEFSYNNLLTAHHLGDRFEWMLMQFCKGAGCAELSGMQEIQDNKTYKLIRPLLHIDKQEILDYLEKKNLVYFNDETNNDKTIKRNSFRHDYTQPLLEEHLSGIKKSFEYIDEDRKLLIKDIVVNTINDFAYFKNSYNKRSTIYAIDKYLKSIGHMITAAERELLKVQTTLEIGRKYIINQNEKFVFIAPIVSNEITLDKEFKEECRKLNIVPELRKYFYINQNIFFSIKEIYSNP